MASTFAVTRNHLIFGLCLPLAVLLGYMLADIADPASRAVIILALSILAVPVLLRWHHALLVLSWNAAMQPVFLPGSPHLWALMALLSLGFAVLNRSLNAEHRISQVPSLTRPLLVLAGVVVATAVFTGGIGLRVFGSTEIGGRGYFYILAAVAGFFALSSRAIPLQRAKFYVALFFLPGLTSIVARAASMLGRDASIVYALFPANFQTDDFVLDPMLDLGMERIVGTVGASFAVYCWLLARFGIAGVFDLTRPWRIILLVTAGIAGMFGGFRSALLLMMTIFFVLFCLEKLWRTRLVVVLLAGAVLGGTLLVGFANRLPLTVQRTLSFLPLDIDPLTKESAVFSTQWRVDMWKLVLPEVPNYLFKGKGYLLKSDDLFMAQMKASSAGGVSYGEAAFAGDYHNGPLSVVIPFGIYGLLAFLWMGFSGTRFLVKMHREGDPELQRINAFLLALFLARLIFFFFIFGSLYVELFQFTGILGFSVALNVTGRRQLAEGGEAATAEVGA